MNESEDDYESFLRKKRWRKTKDLFRLHEIKVRYPQLNNHVLMEMVWDWLDEKSPKQELVSDVWESSSQFLINVEYQVNLQFYPHCLTHRVRFTVENCSSLFTLSDF